MKSRCLKEFGLFWSISMISDRSKTVGLLDSDEKSMFEVSFAEFEWISVKRCFYGFHRLFIDFIN